MNPFNLIRKLSDTTAKTARHMTWASASLSRSFSRTRFFFKKQIWIWPVVAVLFLSVLGYGVRSAIEHTMRENLKSQLQTLLDVETAMINKWYANQSSNAEMLANNSQIRAHIYRLLGGQGEASSEAVPEKMVHEKLAAELAPAMKSHNYIGYFVADKEMKIISASNISLVAQEKIEEYEEFLSRTLEGKGKTVVSPPFPSVVMMKSPSGRMRMGMPTMYVCTPVRDTNFQIVAVLALQIRPEKEFTRILQLGRMGVSGETYAFDAQGRMVSNSRFDTDLILLGLLQDEPDSQSILKIQIRDPGGNIPEGYRPKVRRSEQPLTVMAAAAVQGKSGINLDGYRDYRGVNVVGAWTWLPEHNIGITTEIDHEEAYRPLAILQRTFYGLYALLGFSSVAIFVFTIIVARMRRETQRAAMTAQKLGQYELEEKLGVGGMGVVYKGHHAMLRRPTAIKLLDIEKVNEDSIKRFEREVQITCRLNHPNTIAIYDYGRTPEGLFYYAMEYLDGIDLEKMVNQFGPQLEGRVIHILLQACGSLYEAHSLGLVHRDIKPANIMINRRGGEADVIKVLDFGLVKAMNGEKQAGLTAANSLTGTPLYMSPEAIQNPNLVDARSDIYALGAVGYFLLTGKLLFDAENLVELCQKQVSEIPVSPSSRLEKPVSEELESALLACLEKSPFKRPQTARDLASLLKNCPAATSWEMEQAEAWWGRYERGETQFDQARKSTSSVHIEQTIIADSPHIDEMKNNRPD